MNAMRPELAQFIHEQQFQSARTSGKKILHNETMLFIQDVTAIPLIQHELREEIPHSSYYISQIAENRIGNRDSLSRLSGT
jgi:hypothetical protein